MVIGNARQSGFLHALVRVPPFLIVTSAAALAYTQAPKLEPTISGFFAPPPVVALPPPVRVIDQTPVATITPEPPPRAAGRGNAAARCSFGETRGKKARASCGAGGEGRAAAGAPLRLFGLSAPLPARLCAGANSDSVRSAAAASSIATRGACAMSDEAETAESPAPAEPPRGYFVTLAAATAAAGVGGFAFWASQNMRIGQPLWWQVGSLAAFLVAGKLTLAATKQQSQMRPQGSLLDSFNAKLDAATLALSHMPEGETTTAKTETPAPSRIEAERERLAKAGFGEAEISQILIARETGAAQGMGGGHGVLSGVLSNLAAVMTHARNFLPSLAVDLARMLSRRVPPLQRMEAAFSLVAKCAVIAVLAYVVQLEFVTLKANAQRAKADACQSAHKGADRTSSTMNELLSSSTNQKIDELCGK